MLWMQRMQKYLLELKEILNRPKVREAAKVAI